MVQLFFVCTRIKHANLIRRHLTNVHEVSVVTYIKAIDARIRALANTHADSNIYVIEPNITFEAMIARPYFGLDRVAIVCDCVGIDVVCIRAPNIFKQKEEFVGKLFAFERAKRKPRKEAIVLDAKKKKLIAPRLIEPERAADEEPSCVVCMDNKVTHMAFPCMHYQLCGICSAQVKECPTCREPVERYMTPIV